MSAKNLEDQWRSWSLVNFPCSPASQITNGGFYIWSWISLLQPWVCVDLLNTAHITQPHGWLHYSQLPSGALQPWICIFVQELMSPVEHGWRNSCLPSSTYNSKFNSATAQSPKSASSLLLPRTICHSNFHQLILSWKNLCFRSFSCKLQIFNFGCRFFFFIKTEELLGEK